MGTVHAERTAADRHVPTQRCAGRQNRPTRISPRQDNTTDKLTKRKQAELTNAHAPRIGQ